MNVLKRYIFWTYPRGSFHYDVMVTLILAFLFLSPHFIDFKDKPVPAVPLHSSQVLVKSVGGTPEDAQFTYEVRVEDLDGVTTDQAIRAGLLRIIQPIAGNVTLERYTPLYDAKGAIVAYDATVVR